MARRPPRLEATTLWRFGSRTYEGREQGSNDYAGATPAWVVWNLLQRYTEPGWLVVDPMAGSGTTVDVARELGRRALGYDLQPAHEGVFRADARHLPLEDEKADFVFVDPPYGRNLRYSGRPECIGELDARDEAYFEAMDQVFAEIDRVLRPDRHLAVYVCDVWTRRAFVPIGARFVFQLVQRFEPVDHIAVERSNADLRKGNYRKAAEETGFFLRGFNHLLVFRKPGRRAR
ncbi:MAG: DNA methylase [Planctomycetota bacterium]|nr:MAG: DNA methylase [Planctomycetota bacterium]